MLIGKTLQIRTEVAGVLNFMAKVYGIFDFKFKLYLSTRPTKVCLAQPKSVCVHAALMMLVHCLFDLSLGRLWARRSSGTKLSR